MATLTDSNSSVDRGSGAVLFHKSPELKELLLLRKELQEMKENIQTILELLREVKENGKTLERRR